MTLTVEHLQKTFKKIEAVRDVSFTLQDNSIYGLLGRNGAGKSTVLKLITHRLEKNGGTITLDGEDLWKSTQAMGEVYLSSTEDWFPTDWKVSYLLKTYQAVYPDFDMEFAEELVTLFEVNRKSNFLSLSTGYKSIVKIILALCVPARFVFLDEPVLGLDANHRQLFNKKLLEAYGRRPRTFVIATHLIEEVATLLEEVIVIRDGVTLQQASVERILQQSYLVSGSRDAVLQATAGLEVLHEETLGQQTQVVVLGQLAESSLTDVQVRRLNLQEYFIQLTRKEGE